MVERSLAIRVLCLFGVSFFSSVDAFSASTAAAAARRGATPATQPALGSSITAALSPSTTTPVVHPTPLISSASVDTIANGGVAVLRDFIPRDLVDRMRNDAKQLQQKGYFRPDGLTNYALGDTSQQGFTKAGSRQTFRGGTTANGSNVQSWFAPELGDYDTRMEFESLLAALRKQLAADLDRPTLFFAPDREKDRKRYEITYNWYEPGAKLGRHLDEHHEETKGLRGWKYPTRRSVTWLVYLNDDWKTSEGGALRCHPRQGHDGTNDVSKNTIAGGGPIGCHEGNLQVGWMDEHTPVYLDAFRESGGTALYSCKQHSPTAARQHKNRDERVYWSKRDFDVPAQPIDFGSFMTPSARDRFEQISTATKDPRFATAATAAASQNAPGATNLATPAIAYSDTNVMDVTPSGGTLVLFDSVTLPHSVLEVTGNRQRIAATGWFHEDSQFAFGV